MRAESILRGIALATVPVVGAFACVLMLQVSGAVERVSNGATGTIGEVNTALATINRACLPGPCGTLAKVDQTMNETDSAIFEANRSFMDFDQVEQTERAIIPVWNGEVTAALGDVQKTALQTRMSVQAISDGVTPVLRDTDSTVRSFEALQTSADVKTTLDNVNATSLALAEATKHADATLGDVQFEADKFAHPPKKKLGFWGSIMAGIGVLHKFEPPLF